jgi:hypothetical protein
LVTDETGLSSEPYVYEVNVTSCGEASPELVVATSSSEAPRPQLPVQLSVSVSDADEACGDEASYRYEWRLSAVPNGSAASISQPSLAAPSVTPDLPGDYEASCVVTDFCGLSAEARVSFTVSSCGVNAPVVNSVASSVNGGASPEAFVGSTVSFTPAITDADHGAAGCELDERLSYRWWLTAAPAGSRANLNASSVISPSLSPDVAGDYALRLVVTDAQGFESEPFDLSLSVTDCGASAPEGVVSYASQAPGRADPLAPHAGDLISLTLSASDADSACGAPVLSYQWRVIESPAGSEASLNAPRSLTPSFTADLPGRYAFAVIITDETGLTSAELVTEIDVDDCGSFAPVIDAGAVSQSPALVNAGQRVLLDANAATSDEDSEATCGRSERFSYMWRLASAPAGSQSSLNLADSATPSFTPDLDGSYALEVIARDLRGHESEPVTVSVEVGTCGLSAPSVTPNASSLTPPTGATVQLSATSADPDTVAPCVDPAQFSYHWSFEEVPAGSTAQLNAPMARTPSFVADVRGDYILRVVSVDSRGLESAPANITVSAQLCGDASPAISAVSSSTAVPRVGLPVSLQVAASDSDNDVGCELGQGLSYHWALSVAPAGSEAMVLNAMTVAPSIIPDLQGDYELNVTVTDSTGRFSQDSFSFTVGACGLRAPVLDSLSFNPAAPLIGVPTVAAASFIDPDNEPGCDAGQSHQLEWRVSARPAGSSASFSSPNLDEPSFSPDLEGEYEVQVRAIDSAGVASAWVSQQFTVSDCGGATPSVSVVASELAPNVDERVELSAVVIDTDEAPGCGQVERFAYQWRLISRPEGSSTALSGAELESASLTPDSAGVYQLGLRVSDSAGNWSDEASLSVVATDCGGAAPVVDVVSFSAEPASPVLGRSVQLIVDVNDADEAPGCDLPQEFSYHWVLTEAPAGSQASLNNADLEEPSFTPDVAGDYGFTMWVSDQSGRISEVELFSVTVPDCGLSAPVAAITKSSPVGDALIGDVVQLSGAGSADPDVACGVNEALSYSWTLMSIPPDSRAALSLTTGLTPWFEADVEGRYVVRLLVSDGLHSSEPVDFEVDVLDLL